MHISSLYGDYSTGSFGKNAKDFIESAGNEKAVVEYEKYREEKNMNGERLEMILSDQAEKDAKTGVNKDAILAVAGYQRLSDPQKRLFFKVLQRRDLLDISKKNLKKQSLKQNQI